MGHSGQSPLRPKQGRRRLRPGQRDPEACVHGVQSSRISMAGNSLTIPMRWPCFLGDSDDSGPPRVREFPGGRASRHSLFHLSIFSCVPKWIPLRPHFYDSADPFQGFRLGFMSQDQYDGQQASHAKLPPPWLAGRPIAVPTESRQIRRTSFLLTDQPSRSSKAQIR